MRSIKFLLAGIILGILFAPDKGSSTRKKIGEKIKHCKNEAEETFDEASEKVKSTAEKIKKDVKDTFK